MTLCPSDHGWNPPAELSERPHACTPSVRVGVDLCSVVSVRDSIERFGERYLRRVYTDAELAYAGDEPETQAQRLAARFAAKEATVKLLRPIDRPDWRTLEICHDPVGWTDLVLTGRAAQLAAEAGLSGWSVSLSHDGALAVAVVAAVENVENEPKGEMRERARNR